MVSIDRISLGDEQGMIVAWSGGHVSLHLGVDRACDDYGTDVIVARAEWDHVKEVMDAAFDRVAADRRLVLFTVRCPQCGLGDDKDLRTAT